MSNYIYLVMTLALVNLLQLMVIMSLIKRRSSEYEDAVKKIDGILSGLKPEKPRSQASAPDPRKPLEWKIKR